MLPEEYVLQIHTCSVRVREVLPQCPQCDTEGCSELGLQRVSSSLRPSPFVSICTAWKDSLGFRRCHEGRKKRDKHFFTECLLGVLGPGSPSPEHNVHATGESEFSYYEAPLPHRITTDCRMICLCNPPCLHTSAVATCMLVLAILQSSQR